MICTAALSEAVIGTVSLGIPVPNNSFLGAVEQALRHEKLQGLLLRSIRVPIAIFLLLLVACGGVS